jgi:hypothetical protein
VLVARDAGRVDGDLFPHFPSLQRAAAQQFSDDYRVAELERISEFRSRLTPPAA